MVILKRFGFIALMFVALGCTEDSYESPRVEIKPIFLPTKGFITVMRNSRVKYVKKSEIVAVEDGGRGRSTAIHLSGGSEIYCDDSANSIMSLLEEDNPSD